MSVRRCCRRTTERRIIYFCYLNSLANRLSDYFVCMIPKNAASLLTTRGGYRHQRAQQQQEPRSLIICSHRSIMPSNNDEDETASASRAGTNPLAIAGRFLNVGAIGILSAVSAILFIQLQAVSLRVASEQYQIDELKK